MPLTRQRVAELVREADPNADATLEFESMPNDMWAPFSRFIELVQEEAVSGEGSWVNRDDIEKHIRDLDAALNPTQARSALARDPDLIDVVAQAIPVLQASRIEVRELNLLRQVYEASRAFLRYNGIDQERASQAVDRLDDAIERVKQFDGGQLEDY